MTTAVAAVVLVFAAAFSAAAAPAATGPVGTFTGKLATTIKQYVKFNGTWKLQFFAGGRYTISRNGVPLIHGTSALKNGWLTFGHETGPAACPASQPGVYNYLPSHNGKELSFSIISDHCPGRSVVLASILFKRVA